MKKDTRLQEQGLKCRGTRDMLAEDMARFRHIEGVFRDRCTKWGYQEVRTPTLEYMHLFTATGTLTPGMLGKVYSFLDWDGWSGERVVLRPDCTIPVARLHIEGGNGPGLARLFYVTNVFAFEQTGKESREKWQCGAEFLGGQAPWADAELLCMALETLRLLGVARPTLSLSHIGVLRALLEGMELGLEEKAETLDRVLDGDMAALSEVADRDGKMGKFLSLLLEGRSHSSGFLKNLRAMLGGDTTALAAALDDFIKLAELLEAVSCPYEIDMASARGFEYYTGPTYLFSCGDRRVGGGGRYDALLPLMGGGAVPASGLALDMENLAPILLPGAGLVSPWKGVHVTSPQTPAAVSSAFAVARILREAGFCAEIAPAGYEGRRWSWRLLVEPPAFTLLGPGGESVTASSPAEVLRYLE
ncbi:MAG: ATP phosphoribosyltransferase regulatory subunit, partial [Chloroflexi bacterium]|nr:ATP phosphoribosyltransferase regulatory subunit [Chloroflexota bacterium]